MQIIINAGGSGTRLWPLSTKAIPKQFSNILDNESLIQKTISRLIDFVPYNDIWVTTNVKHINLAKNNLGSEFIQDHILTEPSRRDTYAAVIAHAAVVASKTSRQESLIFISSDHYYNPLVDQKNFNSTLSILDKNIKTNQYSIILPATKPYFPSTNYGYIKSQSPSTDSITPVLEFKEKPNSTLAQSFFESGQYLWNLGYFAFNFDSLSNIVAQLDPISHLAIESIYTKGIITDDDYNKIKVDSFDFAVLEKCQNLGVIDMNLTTWDDIGSFETIYNYLPDSKDNTYVQEVGGSNNKVKTSTNTKVAFVGVSNLLVIENENGILIIDPNKTEGIKTISNLFDKEDL
jgi:mannose-1-phosphate guanylyltransferase